LAFASTLALELSFQVWLPAMIGSAETAPGKWSFGGHCRAQALRCHQSPAHSLSRPMSVHFLYLSRSPFFGHSNGLERQSDAAAAAAAATRLGVSLIWIALGSSWPQEDGASKQLRASRVEIVQIEALRFWQRRAASLSSPAAQLAAARWPASATIPPQAGPSVWGARLMSQ